MASLLPLPQARGIRTIGGYEKYSAPMLPSRRPSKLSRLAMPIVAFVAALAIGFGIGAYVERRGRDGEPARAGATVSAATVAVTANPAPTPPAAPTAPQTLRVTPIVEPLPSPPPTIPPNTVRLESTPAGATVMLVDRGTTVFLGTTPIATALDPARTHELVFSLEGHRTQVMKLDPSAKTQLAIDLEPMVAENESAAADAGARDREPADKPRKKRKKRRDSTDEASNASGDDDERATRKKGKGVLMVSTKPPCEIFIDGEPTNLVTPQRAIPVRAGRREIKLVNAEHGISRRTTVTITADESTKLIRDFFDE
jgi:hypothetical protein